MIKIHAQMRYTREQPFCARTVHLGYSFNDGPAY